jgi:hypothetical protein
MARLVKTAENAITAMRAQRTALFLARSRPIAGGFLRCLATGVHTLCYADWICTRQARSRCITSCSVHYRQKFLAKFASCAPESAGL